MTDDCGTPQSHPKVTGLLDAGHSELFLGRSPSLRHVRLHVISMDNNHMVDQHMMPKMVLRRDGEDLRSDFVALLETCYGDKGYRVQAVGRLPIDGGPKGAVVRTYSSARGLTPA